MITRGHRRDGIASLPVAIFFIALVAASAAAAGALASSQSSLANKQLSVESTLGARQAELNGLTATTSGGGVLQIAQSGGAATSLVYAVVQTSGGRTESEPLSYAIQPGRSLTIDLTDLVKSAFGGSLPSVSSVTLVTGLGVYITSQVKTMQVARQTTTYEQQQVAHTGQRTVAHTTPGYWETVPHVTPGYWTTQTTQVYHPPYFTFEQVRFWNPPYFTFETVRFWNPGFYQLKDIRTWSPGYYTYHSVPGHWVTYRYWVSGYCTSNTYTFYREVRVTTGGYWTIGWRWIRWGPGDMMQVPYFRYVRTYSYELVPVTRTYSVCHPGHWATGREWVPGYGYSVWHPGHWVTETVSVWHPGFYSTMTASVYHPGFYTTMTVSTLHPGYYTTQTSRVWHPPTTTYTNVWVPPTTTNTVESYTYTTTETVPVTTTTYTNALSPTLTQWLIGG